MNIIIHVSWTTNPQLYNKYMHIARFHIHARGARMCVLTTFMSLSTCVCRSYPIPSFVFPCRERTQVIFRSRVRPKKAYKSITKRCESKAAFFATQLTSADVRGVVCSSKTNHLYKVQGLTVWFKMGWYAHFIFCCYLAALYSYLLVATWVFEYFECMYSKYDVCTFFS